MRKKAVPDFESPKPLNSREAVGAIFPRGDSPNTRDPNRKNIIV